MIFVECQYSAPYYCISSLIPSALRPVPVTSDHELSVIKSRLAEIKAQLNRGAKEKERKGSTLDKDGSFVSEWEDTMNYHKHSLSLSLSLSLS